jgi:hypothetical protein
MGASLATGIRYQSDLISPAIEAIDNEFLETLPNRAYEHCVDGTNTDSQFVKPTRLNSI